MSTPGPDDPTVPSHPPSELGGLDPKDLINAGLETVQPVTLPPQPVDSDATIAVAGPRPSQPGTGQVELPLPEELTNLLPHGNYHVESFLGQGGMGAVYKGVQVRLKRPVAIKIMRRDLGKDHDFEARFEREAQAMAKLNHPNIVSVIDYGEAGPDYLYIVMELVEGADMMDVIRGGQMTQEMALSLLPQICDALQFAHDHGIVHRDIKPSNIMLTRDGRIKMADFGLAKRFDAESSFRTQTGTGMGTPDYAAPEQFDTHAPIDHRADIYALGVMIYQMITGQLPRGVWKPPSQRAEIAPQWDNIVSRAMQSDPKDRYQQASEVKTDVSSIPLSKEGSAKERSADTPVRPNQSGGAAAKQNEAGRSARAPVKSRAPLLFGLIVGAAVLALGVFFALKKPEESRRGRQTAEEAPSSSDIATPPRALASAPTPASGPEFPESGWKPLLSEADWKKNWPGKREVVDGVLHLTMQNITRPLNGADGAVRARIVFREGSEHVAVLARSSGGNETYKLNLRTDGVFLSPIGADGKNLPKIGSASFAKPLKPGDKTTLELRVQGDRLTALVDGKVVIEGINATYSRPGAWGIMANDGWFESAEIQALPAAATPAPIAATALPESGWKPLFTEKEWKAKPGFKNGQLHVSHARATKPQSWSDGAIRARIEYRDGSKSPSLVARQTQSSGGFYYRLGVGSDGKHIYLSHMDPKAEGNYDILGRGYFPAPLKLGDKLLLELRAQGGRLTGLLDGKVIIEAQDTRLQAPGEWGIIADEGWFESVEVQPLPAAVTGIKLWDAPEKLPKQSGVSWENGSLRLDKAFLDYYTDKKTRDAILRVSMLMGGDNAGGAIIYLGSYSLAPIVSATTGGNVAELRCLDTTGKSSVLTRWPMPISHGSEEWVRFEFRIEGDQISALTDGHILGTFRDSTNHELGKVRLHATRTAHFRDIEYVALDAPAVSHSPAPQVSKSSDPAAIKLWDTPEKLPEQTGVSWENGALRLDATPITYRNTTSRDLAFRATALVGSDLAGGVSLFIHHNSKKGSYALSLNGDAAEIRIAASGQPTRVLAKWPLPRSYRPDEWLRLEIRVEEARLTALADGQILGSVEDRTLAEPDRAQGSVSIVVVRTGYFRDIEYVPLNTPSVPPSPNLPVSKSSDPKFPPGQWVKLFTKPEDLPADLRKPGSGVTWEDGWIRFDVGKAQRLHVLDSLTNYGIRTKILRQGEEYQNKHLFVRAKQSGKATGYSLVLNDHTSSSLAALKFENGASQSSIWFVKPPAVRLPAVGEEYTLEWACVGSKLVARYGTDFVKVTTDASFAAGGAFITGGEPIRDIEVINLDGLPEADALRLLGVDEKGNDLRGKTGAGK